MSSQSIHLLSLEGVKNSLWEQYWQLTEAREETIKALTGFGETKFPTVRVISKPEIKPIPQALPPRPQLQQTDLIKASAPEGADTQAKTPSPLRQRIREAVSDMATGFSRRSVREWLETKYPMEEINDGSFSSTFAMVGKKDGWKTLIPAAGGKPGTYATKHSADIVG